MYPGAAGIGEFEGQLGTIAGWGRSESGKAVEQTIKKTIVKIIDKERCKSSNIEYANINRSFCAGEFFKNITFVHVKGYEIPFFNSILVNLGICFQGVQTQVPATGIRAGVCSFRSCSGVTKNGTSWGWCRCR